MTGGVGLVGTTEAMQHLNRMIDFDEEISEEVVLSYSQKQQSILVDQTLYRTLLDQTVQVRTKVSLVGNFSICFSKNTPILLTLNTPKK